MCRLLGAPLAAAALGSSTAPRLAVQRRQFRPCSHQSQLHYDYNQINAVAASLWLRRRRRQSTKRFGQQTAAHEVYTSLQRIERHRSEVCKVSAALANPVASPPPARAPSVPATTLNSLAAPRLEMYKMSAVL